MIHQSSIFSNHNLLLMLSLLFFLNLHIHIIENPWVPHYFQIFTWIYSFKYFLFSFFLFFPFSLFFFFFFFFSLSLGILWCVLFSDITVTLSTHLPLQINSFPIFDRACIMFLTHLVFLLSTGLNPPSCSCVSS